MDNFEQRAAYINQQGIIIMVFISLLFAHMSYEYHEDNPCYFLLTFVHVLGVVEGEGDGEAAEEEDGGCDAPHHHALPAVARALGVSADETGGKVALKIILQSTLLAASK